MTPKAKAPHQLGSVQRRENDWRIVIRRTADPYRSHKEAATRDWKYLRTAATRDEMMTRLQQLTAHCVLMRRELIEGEEAVWVERIKKREAAISNGRLLPRAISHDIIIYLIAKFVS